MENASTLSPVKQALLKKRLKEAFNRTVSRREISKRPNPQWAPLSFSQSQMWFIDQMNPGNPAYNLPHGFRLRGKLDLAALHHAFNEIIMRHEALRTTFVVKDGEPRQLVHPELQIKIKAKALDHLNSEERERKLQALASEESVRPFDLTRLPLIRVSLFKLAEAEHVLMVNLHHIVADGLSVGLLMNELDLFYRTFTGGGGSPLPELAVQYGDFASWQQETMADESAHAGQIEYWQKQLGGTLPVLELPCDSARPALQSFNGANVFFDLPAELVQDLKSVGSCQGCTFFMTVLAAFQVLLHRYSGAEDIVIGTPVGVRTPTKVASLIGNFLNMAALRCDVSGDPTFIELLRKSRDTALNAFSNSDLPFEAMMKHLKFERDPSRNPIFQVLLQVLPATVPRLGDLEISSFLFDLKFAQFDLSLHLYKDGERYGGRFEYCSDLFEAQTVQRMCKHFVSLLKAIAAEPNRNISTLPMLDEAERHQLLVEWNDTAATGLRKDLCLHQLIEAQANRTPDRVAISFERQTLTYAELNRRANQLAHYLKGKGVGPDVLVALFAERSLEMLIGVVGVLKAGSAYVPIDPNYPKERIGYILEDSKSPIILTQDSLAKGLPNFGGQKVCLDRDWNEISSEPAENPATKTRPEHLAYVLFTSGSTGRPKGVALEHRSAVAFVQWASQVFTPRELAGVLFSTSICFDLSVFEIFVTLATGGKIVIARNALHLPTLPEKDEVTLINTVPSAIAELVHMGGVPASVITVNLAGEALSDALVEQIYANTNCESIYNLYGPTETTTYSTYTLVGRGSPATIGKPITGTQCYILDAHRNPMPVGVPGELYIAGDGLARGYHGRPDLTNERFVPNPFSKEPAARMYRTGDLCRWLPDGNVQYLGRMDHQVKLRGFRIELGEIEAGIARHSAVREVTVIAREDTPGDKHLVAYMVAENPPADFVEQLRALIRTTMPEYMLPAHFIALEKMPRTPNGKLDRKALPPPAASDAAPRHGAVAPRTPTEETVANAFRGVLGRNDFGVHDNFFELGGHSLMAARLMSTLRAASGAELSLRDLFTRPTAAGLAEAIDALQWVQKSKTPTSNDAVREEFVL